MANKKVKYKLIPEVVIDNLIAFLDEIQFESSMIENEESLNKMNFCSWALKELVNAYPISEIVNMDDVLGKNKKKNDKRSDIIDEYFLDWELPDDMSDDEFEKLVAQFDGFLKGWEKKYKEGNSKRRGKKRGTSHFKRPLIEDISDYMTLDEIKEYLLDDPELTDEEKFDLYYEQYLRVKKYEEIEEAKSNLNKILAKMGIKKVKKNQKK